jgi:hypothetical protein
VLPLQAIFKDSTGMVLAQIVWNVFSLHQPESFEKGLNLKAIAVPNKACQDALRSHSDDPQWFGIASWSNG